ncbi:tRNA (guanosine(46)-N7)-methyltransferase TrmB [Peptostreptococcus canis]|uniref:tRNA (guanine-N(7)-)-methyltransferase n=1 Tax=Peptostreptococcus canis TaxID=1159213 RepID=A0ABR6TJY0_9FIRM|nr:tRNA (guanosine(46)-N7)-methyltransferase TrmB [Peptostreptococcus canis]MBC2575717.1 tRNA (guanosine(46)-N7)-methyltransferase TrmB [Peptostreptococcus canis]MBP1998168.1 tRNA (guanine-N7-)-methyltransferase [Peptostreptococcus canis]
MRRRKKKGSDEKLLSYKDFIVNGMIKQASPKDNSGDCTLFDYRILIEDEIYKDIINNYKGKWNIFFENENPIHIEVGTGRGKFITTLAKENPDINYIALEVKEEVLVKAVEKADKLNLNNIAFLWGNVELLDTYFDDDELDRIYINFCDPWHKNRYAKKRLTHHNFLELYRKKLKNNSEIHFKTDNSALFEFSLNEFCNNDWKLKNISLNLAKSSWTGNITTEYEDRYMNLGMPIYRLEAKDIR